jgi:hypothetical protein
MNSFQTQPPSLERFIANLNARILEGERGVLLRAIERTLISMPFGGDCFDATNETLKRERKKNAPPPMRKARKAGDGSTEQVKKGYELYQKYVDAAGAPDWEAIAYECLKRPGESAPKATWKQRKGGFRKAVDGHRYRLQREARQREK